MVSEKIQPAKYSSVFFQTIELATGIDLKVARYVIYAPFYLTVVYTTEVCLNEHDTSSGCCF